MRAQRWLVNTVHPKWRTSKTKSAQITPGYTNLQFTPIKPNDTDQSKSPLTTVEKLWAFQITPGIHSTSDHPSTQKFQFTTNQPKPLQMPRICRPSDHSWLPQIRHNGNPKICGTSNEPHTTLLIRGELQSRCRIKIIKNLSNQGKLEKSRVARVMFFLTRFSQFLNSDDGKSKSVVGFVLEFNLIIFASPGYHWQIK